MLSYVVRRRCGVAACMHVCVCCVGAGAYSRWASLTTLYALQDVEIAFPNNDYFYWPTQMFMVRLVDASPAGLAFVNEAARTATVTIENDDGVWWRCCSACLPQTHARCCCCCCRGAHATDTATSMFLETYRVAHPKEEVINILVRRQGNNLLESKLRLLFVPRTVDGLTALPNEHFEAPGYANGTGQWFILPAGTVDRHLPVKVLRKALLDLNAAHESKVGRVRDATIEFDVVIVEGINTLFPEDKNAGGTVTVRITLQGQPPAINRFGEVPTAAVTLAAVAVLIIAVAWIWHYRRAQERRKEEEHALLAARATRDANDSASDDDDDLVKHTDAVVTIRRPRSGGAASRRARFTSPSKRKVDVIDDEVEDAPRDDKYAAETDVDGFVRARNQEMQELRVAKASKATGRAAAAAAGAGGVAGPGSSSPAGSPTKSSSSPAQPPRRRSPSPVAERRLLAHAASAASPQAAAGGVPSPITVTSVMARKKAVGDPYGVGGASFSFTNPLSPATPPVTTSPGAIGLFTSSHAVTEMQRIRSMRRERSGVSVSPSSPAK